MIKINTVTYQDGTTYTGYFTEFCDNRRPHRFLMRAEGRFHCYCNHTLSQEDVTELFLIFRWKPFFSAIDAPRTTRWEIDD